MSDDKKVRESCSVEEGFALTIHFFKELQGKYKASQAEVARLSAEVEELMRVDYWQDRYNIEKKAREAAEGDRDRTEKVYQMNREYVEDAKEKLRIAIEALKEAAEFARMDDINGAAGDIAKEALERLKA